MKIAIAGTRGIPNNYSGFEQLAEYLSKALVEMGHEVYVYSSHNHLYQQPTWHGVNIIHQYDPEYKVGTFGQFIYDYNCIRDSRKRDFDVILLLGYTSSSVWGWLLPKKAVVFSNMDGLEWKRSKYSPLVQRFLKVAERLAVQTSDYLVADSLGIQSYLKDKYSVQSTFIPYGAHAFHQPDASVPAAFDLQPYGYDMLMARMEPENNIATILQGVQAARTERPFLVIGNYKKKYGYYVYNRYNGGRIRFIGGLFDIGKLNSLRYFSNLYFHGHSVGGTNPSLLEAMASGALICAHRNEFNESILNEHAYYFSDSGQVRQVLEIVCKTNPGEADKIGANTGKIEYFYTWDKVNRAYEELLRTGWQAGKRR